MYAERDKVGSCEGGWVELKMRLVVEYETLEFVENERWVERRIYWVEHRELDRVVIR